MTSFVTFGDCGDCIYLMPSMRLFGEPVILYGKDGLRLENPFTERLWLIKDLFESQPYIKAVLPWNGEEVTHDATHFRKGGHPFGVTLASLQAQWLGLSPDLTSPWLKVIPNPRAPIIINRSARYHNIFFPWIELVQVFDNDMLFIGLEEEHEAFCREFFCSVGYLPTETLLEAAEAIAGSELFIGNQSSCYAIAEALKHASIQETDLTTPDCIFPRPNATYCHNGELDFTFHGKRFTSKNRLFVRAHLNDTPPGGWRVAIGEYKANSYAINLALTEITTKLRLAGMPVPNNLMEIIIEQNSCEHLDHPVARLKAELNALS